MTRDTIYAISSGAGRAALAVLRLSGRAAGSALSTLAQGDLPPPRRATVRALRDASGEMIDQALVLWMPGPASFTGEDVAELHVHGGLAVQAAILRAVSSIPECRPAEAGEFTRRAFLNGRMDLTEVEGLADLIAADTEAQRRQSVRQMEGALSRASADWRESLLMALAQIEALLDFSDEEDVPERLDEAVLARVADARRGVTRALQDAGRGERLRDGVTVVIAGPPNAGKSTLLNAIARRDVAIVSDIPGTTRDAIEVRCDLDGIPVTFVDTAGLRESLDPVEQAGVTIATSRMQAADLVLRLEPVDVSPNSGIEFPSGIPALVVRTKIDLLAESRSSVGRAGNCLAPEALGKRESGGPDAHFQPCNQLESIGISAQMGEGVAELLDRIRDHVVALIGDGEGALLTRERHRVILSDMSACLDRALEPRPSPAPELVAEDLRLALRALGRMTGEVDVEEVLDRIFASFCIGK